MVAQQLPLLPEKDPLARYVDKVGQQIVVRGKIRISRKDRLYLALHSPFDLEIIER